MQVVGRVLLMAAQQGAWAQVEGVVKKFQDVCMRLKYSSKPTVAAPFAMALGGGAELSMGADRICAHADLFMGLVEVGVGLMPGGGGHKELLIRNLNENGFHLEPLEALFPPETLPAARKVMAICREAGQVLADLCEDCVAHVRTSR